MEHPAAGDLISKKHRIAAATQKIKAIRKNFRNVRDDNDEFSGNVASTQEAPIFVTITSLRAVRNLKESLDGYLR